MTNEQTTRIILRTLHRQAQESRKDTRKTTRMQSAVYGNSDLYAQACKR